MSSVPHVAAAADEELAHAAYRPKHSGKGDVTFRDMIATEFAP